MHAQIAVGDSVTLRAVFVDASGAATDPTTVALAVTNPAGSVTTYTYALATVTKDGTGRYSKALTLTSAGVWSYTWTAAGTVDDVQSGRLLVGKTVTDGPCEPWCDPQTIFSVPPLTGVAEASKSYGLATEAVDAASRILFALTSRRYPGICQAVIRPCRRSWGWCWCFSADSAMCRCGSGISEITLGAGYPLVAVSEVLIDGATVDASTYRVDDDSVLVRTDGNTWPYGQNLANDPASEVDTFQVTYFYGRNAPPDGILAARHLAAQLYSASTTGVDCALPQRIRSKTLQGVDLEFLGPEDFDDGQTGVETVDRFLDADRYGVANQGTTIVAPGYCASERRVDT